MFLKEFTILILINYILCREYSLTDDYKKSDDTMKVTCFLLIIGITSFSTTIFCLCRQHFRLSKNVIRDKNVVVEDDENVVVDDDDDEMLIA